MSEPIKILLGLGAVAVYVAIGVLGAVRAKRLLPENLAGHHADVVIRIVGWPGIAVAGAASRIVRSYDESTRRALVQAEAKGGLPQLASQPARSLPPSGPVAPLPPSGPVAPLPRSGPVAALPPSVKPITSDSPGG